MPNNKIAQFKPLKTLRLIKICLQIELKDLKIRIKLCSMIKTWTWAILNIWTNTDLEGIMLTKKNYMESFSHWKQLTNRLIYNIWQNCKGLAIMSLYLQKSLINKMRIKIS